MYSREEDHEEECIMTHNNIETDTSGQAEAIKLQQARQEPQQDQKDSAPQEQRSQARQSAQRPIPGRMPLFRR
jgi:hypothetical protein